MKFLLDQGVPRSTVRHLAAFGFFAEHVGDLGMHAAADEAILDLARSRNAVIVTLDADFHRILSIQKSTTPSVIRVRIEGLKGDRLADLLVQVVQSIGNELNSGAVASIEPTRIRMRRLPLGGNSASSL